MAKEKKVEVVRRLFDLWKEKPSDVPTDLIAPDFELISPLSSLRGRPYRGYDDARQWAQDVNEQFEEWAFTLDEIKEVRGRVLALGRTHLKGRGSGVTLDPEGAWLVDFAPDGRVSRMQVFTDRDKAFEAAGLSE